MIKGVGRDAPIEGDASGYNTSSTPYRMDLLFFRAILHVAEIMQYGAKNHGENNWRKGGVDKHLNKALIHLACYYAGDKQDDHLGHAAWRTMAALEIQLSSEELATASREDIDGLLPQYAQPPLWEIYYMTTDDPPEKRTIGLVWNEKDAMTMCEKHNRSSADPWPNVYQYGKYVPKAEAKTGQG